MRESDAAGFVALLRDVFGLYPNARPLTDGQVAMFFRALAEHTLAAVQLALDAHVRDPERGRFPPVPADVIAKLRQADASDGRPGADEAWAIALRASDESETVVWTREMAGAWEACRPVMAIGDEVGARMAFRDAYNRLVSEARSAGIRPAWSPSLGFDAKRRELAISAAVDRGLLPSSEIAGLLPAPKDKRGPASPKVMAILLELRDRMSADGCMQSADAEAKRQTETAKARTAQLVADYRPEAAQP